MSDVQSFVTRYLAHYASEYYDPAKAREYYLKTRELKGRRSGSGLKSDKKKEAWAYAKDKIETERDELIKETGNELKQDIQIMRTEATQKRKDIGVYLKAILNNISVGRKSESDKIARRRERQAKAIARTHKRESEKIAEEHKKESEKIAERHRLESKKISEETAKKIAALPVIPKGISTDQRARLAAERSAEIAKIRGDSKKAQDSLSSNTDKERKILAGKTEASQKVLSSKTTADRKKISDEVKADREALASKTDSEKAKSRESAAAVREKVSSDLKSAVDGGRAYYEKAKIDIKARYEAKLDTEYNAIKEKV